MAGFEPRISGIRSDRSTNCATTTALCSGIVYSKKCYHRISLYGHGCFIALSSGDMSRLMIPGSRVLIPATYNSLFVVLYEQAENDF